VNSTQHAKYMSDHSTTAIVFRNGVLVDGSGPEPSGQVDVLVEDGTVTAVSETRIEAAGATEYDLAGRAIMPGLIDLHIHPFLTDMNLMKRISRTNTLQEVRSASHSARCHRL
jgi:N-acyl-D-aspartate/D-glutamate deacylase